MVRCLRYDREPQGEPRIRNEIGITLVELLVVLAITAMITGALVTEKGLKEQYAADAGVENALAQGDVTFQPSIESGSTDFVFVMSVGRKLI
jgi:hypothetical protein